MRVSTAKHKTAKPESILSPSCLSFLYVWMGISVGMVCQISRQSKALITACSLAWLLHFILTLWSIFTPSDCFFTSSWSKEQESTCPWLVNHERGSINHYCFSSCFCRALGQGFTPSWQLSWLAGQGHVQQSNWHPSPYPNINQRSVWQTFNCYG